MLNIPVNFDARPPFVRFEEREHGINRAATEAAGRPVPKVEIFACFTSFGSKDSHDVVATEWIAQKRVAAQSGNYPQKWVEDIEAAYQAYLKGSELPREGTPIKTWQMVNRDQVNRCLMNNVTTVEDLAMIPDNSLNMFGLDGRVMRDMARAWIKEGKEKGSVAKELADANAKIAQLEQRLDSLARQQEKANRKNEAA